MIRRSFLESLGAMFAAPLMMGMQAGLPKAKTGEADPLDRVTPDRIKIIPPSYEFTDGAGPLDPSLVRVRLESDGEALKVYLDCHGETYVRAYSIDLLKDTPGVFKSGIYGPEGRIGQDSE